MVKSRLLPIAALLLSAVIGCNSNSGQPPVQVKGSALSPPADAPADTAPVPGNNSAEERVVAEYALDNGLRVRLVPGVGENQAALLLGVRAGFLEEPAGLPHLAHVTEHLTVFDLPLREANAVQEWARTNKANGETLAELMYFDLHVSPADIDLALRVQAARLTAREFARETLLREVPRTLAEVDFVERSQFPAAGKFALAPFVQAAFHGKTDLPIRAQTHKITIEDVQTFHRRTFRPDRAALVVVGDFDPAAVRKAIDLHFGGLPKPSTAPAARPALKSGEHTADWDVATRHLFAAWPVPPAAHADHPALTLASLALMERLAANAKIRALGDAMPVLNDIDGMFLISVQAKPAADMAALKDLVMDQVAELAAPKAWNESETNRLRRFLDQMMMIGVDLDKMPLPPRVTKTMARTNYELQRMMKSMVWGDVDTYRKRVVELKPDAVPGVIGKYLDPKSACIVRVQSAKPAK